MSVNLWHHYSEVELSNTSMTCSAFLPADMLDWRLFVCVMASLARALCCAASDRLHTHTHTHRHNTDTITMININCKHNTALTAFMHIHGFMHIHYAPAKGIAVPAERHGVLQTLICAPVVRPTQSPTSSNPALLRSWMVVCPSFTLLMMLLLPGWPTMGLNRICKKMKKASSVSTDRDTCNTLLCSWLLSAHCHTNTWT